MHPRHRDLQALVHDEDVAGVLAIASYDEIASAWCSYSAREHPEDEEADSDPDWWAVELFFTRAIFDDMALYRALLLKLLEHAPDDNVVGQIGAGPLENIVVDHEDFLTWIEAHAPANERLCLALSTVWADVSETSFARLDRAAGTELQRPLPRDEWPPALIAVEEAMARLVELAGPEWYLLTDPTPEQLDAMNAFLDAQNRLIGNEGDVAT